ncbi:MAG: ADOP family duplicated permease [Candidatus Acidiferrales bacterium]
MNSVLSRIRTSLRALVRRANVETELDEELRFHFDQHVSKLTQSGVPRDEALRQARLAIGTSDSIKEEHRDVRGLRPLDAFAQDVSFALRILAKNWKLATIAMFSLAVAMTLGTIGLGVANGVLVRPPVAAHPENLIEITAASPDSANATFSYPEFVYLRGHATSLDALAAFPYQITKAHFAVGDRSETGMMEIVSDNYFQTMGLVPAAGELFHPGADESHAPLVVLSYAFWQRLGSDPQIAGKTITINSHSATISGVAPEKFTGTTFGFGVDVLETLGTQATFADPHFFTDPQNRWLVLIGRLKPRVTRERAAAEMRTLSTQLALEHPDTSKDRVAVVDSVSALPPDSRSAGRLVAGLLVGAVLLVLLIACANVANLLLGLGTGRRREILVRTALGATRSRLIRQLLTESLILCGVGGLLGFAIASAVLARFARFQATVPVIGSFDIALNFRADAAVALLTLVLILLASLAAGLAPALHASVPNLAGALSGEATIGGRGKGILRGAFVAAEVAICTLVMVGVGLAFRSVRNLENVRTGFDAPHLGGLMIDLSENGFTDPQRPAAYVQVRSLARAIPGVKEVSVSIDFPLGNDSWVGEDVVIPSATGSSAATGSVATAKPHIPRTIVDEHYFDTLGIRLVAGRPFATTDTPASPAVAIVNQTMAQTFWPGESAVGKQFFLPPASNAPDASNPTTAPHAAIAKSTPVTIVGVAANSIYNTLDEPLHPVLYFPLSQRNESFVIAIFRTEGNPRPVLATLGEKLKSMGVKSDLLPFTGRDMLSMALLIPSITLYVIVALGALALMLAVMGLYGAIFYSINERRQEIGIRIALGAGPRNVLALFLRQTALVAGLGVAAGLALGIAATIALRTQLFGIAALEYPVLTSVAIAMMAVSLSVAYIAARPWSAVSPLDAVRHS